MTVAAVLEGARELVLTGWCQRAYARDAQGGKVDELSLWADRWCLIGALRRATGTSPDTPEIFQRALHACYEQHNKEHARTAPGLLTWHDASERTAADVAGFLERVRDAQAVTA